MDVLALGTCDGTVIGYLEGFVDGVVVGNVKCFPGSLTWISCCNYN